MPLGRQVHVRFGVMRQRSLLTRGMVLVLVSAVLVFVLVVGYLVLWAMMLSECWSGGRCLGSL